MMKMCEKSGFSTFLVTFGLLLCYLSPGNAIDAEVTLRKNIARQTANRPVATVNDGVLVTFSALPIHVNHVDEVNGVLTVTIWISQVWTGLFTWDKSQFNDVDKVVVTGEKDYVWYPDITLIHSVGEDSYIPAREGKEFTMKNDGQIIWWMQTTVHSPCDFKESTVRCDLVFGSWQYNGRELDMKVAEMDNNTTPLKFYKKTGLWEVTKVEYSRDVAYYPCCPEPYPLIVFSLEMKKDEDYKISKSHGVFTKPSSLFFGFVSMMALKFCGY